MDELYQADTTGKRKLKVGMRVMAGTSTRYAVIEEVSNGGQLSSYVRVRFDTGKLKWVNRQDVAILDPESLPALVSKVPDRLKQRSTLSVSRQAVRYCVRNWKTRRATF